MIVMKQDEDSFYKISENLEFARRMGIASAAMIIGVGTWTMFQSVRNIWF